MAKLCDVYPTGEARRIADGACRLDGGSMRSCSVDLGHTGYRIRPGHRLRLEVSSSAFPRYIWHPGTTTTRGTRSGAGVSRPGSGPAREGRASR